MTSIVQLLKERRRVFRDVADDEYRAALKAVGGPGHPAAPEAAVDRLLRAAAAAAVPDGQVSGDVAALAPARPAGVRAAHLSPGRTFGPNLAPAQRGPPVVDLYEALTGPDADRPDLSAVKFVPIADTQSVDQFSRPVRPPPPGHPVAPCPAAR